MLLVLHGLLQVCIDEFTEVSHEPWSTTASCTPHIAIAVVYGFHVAVASVARASLRVTIVKATRLES